VAIGRAVNYDVRIVRAALEVNELQKQSIIDRIRMLLPDLTNKTVAVLGLAFKPETDDMREAPSIKIVADLVEAGAKIRAYDPAATESARQFLSGVEYCEDEYETSRGSDALVVVTEWNQFRSLDLGRLKRGMREPNIIDLRNIYEPDMVRAAGFRYVGMGRT
jgi:UDPglucose 6-dehydrogenase